MAKDTSEVSEENLGADKAEATAPTTTKVPIVTTAPVAKAGETPEQPTSATVSVVIPATPGIIVKGEGKTLEPTTTEEEDMASHAAREAASLTTEGQRHINLIWENTQSRIALLVVVAGIAINSAIVTAIIFFGKEVSVTQLALISISLQFINLTTGIVIGFYFSRTNHAATGGVGPKPSEAPYTGR